jgi:hypothetical protein
MTRLSFYSGRTLGSTEEEQNVTQVKVHEAACLRRLLCFRAPLSLFWVNVLIRQQRLGIPNRGICDNPLACFDDC